jgi:hypothetical protein
VSTATGAEHIVVIHRWRDGGALYEPYLDHLLVDVSYIVTPAAAASVPRTAAAVEVVERTDDLAAVANAAARLRQRFGPPTRIVALAAADLDVAAELRVLLGCAGQRPPELALLRDRHAMLTAVAAAGVRVPRFGVVSQGSDVFRLLAERPEPVQLTPRFGSGEVAELLVETPADAERLGGLLAEPMLARSHDPTALRYAVDGIWDGDRLLRWRAARLLGVEPHGLPAGGWRAAVELDGTPAELSSGLAEVAGTALAALLRRPAVVHVEVFALPRAGAAPELSFGWASAGMAGAELPLLWREVHGVDLAAAAIAGQLDRPLPEPSESPPAGSGPIGGWLQIWAPEPLPCRLNSIELPEPAPYAAMLARVGERLTAADPVAASLRFRGTGTAELSALIRAVAEGVRLRCTPL